MLNVQIFCTNVVSAAFFQLRVRRKTMFVRKICTFNVDEIDYRLQFGQSYIYSPHMFSHPMFFSVFFSREVQWKHYIIIKLAYLDCPDFKSTYKKHLQKLLQEIMVKLTTFLVVCVFQDSLPHFDTQSSFCLNYYPDYICRHFIHNIYNVQLKANH